jgi:hypothetical protein
MGKALCKFLKTVTFRKPANVAQGGGQIVHGSGQGP